MSHIDPLRPWIGHEGERTYTGPLRSADFAALGEDYGGLGAILPTFEQQQMARMFGTRGDQPGIGQLQYGALGQGDPNANIKMVAPGPVGSPSGTRVVIPPPPPTPVAANSGVTSV